MTAFFFELMKSRPTNVLFPGLFASGFWAATDELVDTLAFALVAAALVATFGTDSGLFATWVKFYGSTLAVLFTSVLVAPFGSTFVALDWAVDYFTYVTLAWAAVVVFDCAEVTFALVALAVLLAFYWATELMLADVD